LTECRANKRQHSVLTVAAAKLHITINLIIY
jgi:hypothetical protein